MRTLSNHVCYTLDPDNPTGPKIGVEIPADLYLRYYKYSPIQYENLRAVKYVLDHPQRIFWGIREFNEGGWCYVGIPEEWHVRQDVIAPFPKNKVFAVYINPLRRLFEYGAEPADPEDPMSPIGWKDRYRGLKWKNTF